MLKLIAFRDYYCGSIQMFTTKGIRLLFSISTQWPGEAKSAIEAIMMMMMMMIIITTTTTIIIIIIITIIIIVIITIIIDCNNYVNIYSKYSYNKDENQTISNIYNFKLYQY